MARESLFTHRKFARLSRLMGAPYRAAGALEMLWHRAYTDGEARLGSADDVEYVIGWDGEPGACAAAMVEAGFLDDIGDGQLAVHDLLTHAPSYVRRRLQRVSDRQPDDTDAPVTRQRRAGSAPPVATPNSQLPTPNSQLPVATETQSDAEPPDVPISSHPLTDPESNDEPDTTQPPRRPRKIAAHADHVTADCTGFPAWWDAYGCKTARADAEKAWCRDLDDDERAAMTDLTAAYHARRQAATTAGVFVPHLPLPATYLRGKRWLDEYGSPSRVPSNPAMRVGASPDPDEWRWGFSLADRDAHRDDPDWETYCTAYSGELGWGGELGAWPTFAAWQAERAAFLARVDGKATAVGAR